MIVTATGLELQLLSDVPLHASTARRSICRQTLQYKGMMFSDVPNMASSFGYTNASWTLKADLTGAYVCRLLNTMKKRGLRQATPRHTAIRRWRAKPFLDFTSGYVQRAAQFLPKQGVAQAVEAPPELRAGRDGAEVRLGR